MSGYTARLNRPWSLTATLWLTIVFTTAYEILPASILTFVRTGFDIGPTEASWLVSVLLLAMAVFAIPSGYLLDSLENRAVLSLAILVFCLSTIWAWFAANGTDYTSLIIARFIAGITIIVAWTAAINIVGYTFGKRNQGTAMAVLSTAIPTGYAIGHLLGPLVATHLGWQASFPFFGSLAVVSLSTFLIVSSGARFNVDSEVPTAVEVSRIISDPAVLVIASLGFASFSLYLFFLNWLPTFVTDRFALTLTGGGVIGSIFPIIGILARGSGGFVSDRFFGTRRRPMIVASYLVIVPATVLVTVASDLLVLVVAIVIAGFFTQLAMVLLIPYSREIVDDNVAATSFSVFNTVGFLGAFSAPILTGSLIELAGYPAAFVYAGLLGMIGILLAWIAPAQPAA